MNEIIAIIPDDSNNFVMFMYYFRDLQVIIVLSLQIHIAVSPISVDMVDVVALAFHGDITFFT